MSYDRFLNGLTIAQLKALATQAKLTHVPREPNRLRDKLLRSESARAVFSAAYA